MTKNILFVEDLPGGWKLYGKTGNGSQLSKDRMQKLALQQGWFVGWIQKDNRIIVFANHITDDSKQDVYDSLRAKLDFGQNHQKYSLISYSTVRLKVIIYRLINT